MSRKIIKHGKRRTRVGARTINLGGKLDPVKAEALALEQESYEMDLSTTDDAILVGRILSSAPLDRKQRIVVGMRFGLWCQPVSLYDAGAALGLSPERARQIEAKALHILRRHAEIHYMDEV